MIILDIEPYKGETVCLRLSGIQGHETRVYINQGIAEKNGLKKDMEISGEEIDKIVYENDLRRARERALYLLEGRDHSFSELFDKLEKNYSEEICYEVCGKMAELGLINDRRYAESLCRSYSRVKKWGEYRIKAELRRKGISDEIISEVMEEFTDEDDPAERLEELVEKKYVRYLTDRKGFDKVKAALARRGYSYSDINEVLRQYSTEDH